MARKAFFSFHFDVDAWRASKIRNMGIVEGDRPVADNKWEQIKRGGAPAIEAWINSQMHGKSCVIVLIGEATAGRRWINYEIERAWNRDKALLGIHIHKILDHYQQQATKGRNPFADFIVSVGKRQVEMSSLVPVYSPPQRTSTGVYSYIKENLEEWVEDAIERRAGM